ncbi:hypothetical protein [Sphingobacterium sp.]|uniref:hypothetical protein n=1 Tax=Sphingobacterium sp. TaxID=341027 RepID=UPI0028992E3E|nr:hypothetical protein [Sphingobacterium sp.]
MKSLEQIRVPKPVSQVCDIFGLTVEQLVQQFLDHVDLGLYFSDPFDPDRWANIFTINCVLQNLEDEKYLLRYSKFVDRIMETVLSNAKKDALDKVYKIVDEWQKAVLENRIHEIMKDDGDENNGLIEKE